MLSTCEQNQRPGGQQPGDRRRHDARGQQHDHRRPGRRSPRLAPETERHDLTPHWSGVVDDEDVGVVRGAWPGLSHVPAPAAASPAARTISPGPRLLAASLHGQDDEVAARRVTIPGKTVPDRRARSAARRRPRRLRAARLKQPVLVVQVVVGARSTSARALKSERHALGVAVRAAAARPRARRWRWSRPAAEGRPGRTRRSRRRRPPTLGRRRTTITFTGVPVRASIEPAWAANASGMSSWRAPGRGGRRARPPSA